MTSKAYLINILLDYSDSPIHELDWDMLYFGCCPFIYQNTYIEVCGKVKMKVHGARWFYY